MTTDWFIVSAAERFSFEVSTTRPTYRYAQLRHMQAATNKAALTLPASSRSPM